MRKDVKFGLVFSLVVVVLAGWYFVGRGRQDKSVPIGDDTSARDTALAAAKRSADVSPSPELADATRPSQAHRPAKRPEMRKGQSGARQPSQRPAPAERKSSPSRVAQSDKSPDREAAGQPQPAEAAGQHPSISDILSRRTDTPSQPPAGPEAPQDAATVAPSKTGAEPQSPVGPTPEKDITAPGQPPAVAATPGSDQASIATRTKPKAARTTPPGARTHVVESGDTLAILSELYYGSQGHVDVILNANPHVTDPTRLAVGTELVIPPLLGKLPTLAARRSTGEKPAAAEPVKATPATAKPAAAPGTYEVKSGDSFYKIAEKVLGDSSRWPEIFELNKDLVDGKPERLQVGQVLKLPPKEKPTKE
jgi:nucleoid-associated protein YgaU